MKIGLTRTLAGASAIALLWIADGMQGIARSAAQSAGQTGSATAPAPVLAEQVFKNIQALKGISAADFMGTMGIMTAALGFDC
jgi:hypothetical protein